MKLSRRQIESITLGVQEISEEDGYFRFRRMPIAQAGAFAAVNDMFSIRAKSTSSIRFDFYTDSDFLAFEYRVGFASSRGFYSFDADINGKPVYSVSGDITKNSGDESGKFYLELPSGISRVTVWFPALTAGYVKNVELSSGANIERVAKRARILFYGDSITQGYDARFSRNSYVNILADKLDIEAINLGIGASGFEPSTVFPRECDAVSVAYGTNDWAYRGSKEELISHAAGFMDRVAQVHSGKPVCVLLPIWRLIKDDFVSNIGAFTNTHEIIGKLAAERGFSVVNCIDFIPHDFKYYSPDVLHPNDDGFAHFAAALIPVFEKLLRR